MPTQKPEPPAIELLPFKELNFDLIYSGRTKKEIAANAKDLAPQLADGWDSAQPGQYFIGEDGKKYVVAGFTRAEAAKLNDLKSGYFVQTNGDAVTHMTACLRTNSGKPISRKAKGEVFVKLRDGVVADDFKGAIADPKKPEDWKRAPMTLQEIADLPGVGLTGESVRQCILIAESSPEVAQMIEDDLVSPGIVVKSKQLAKGDDDKQLRILRKALSFAKGEQKDKATDKHFDLAKEALYPKKLIADDGEKSPETGKDTKKEEKGQQEAPASGAEGPGDTHEGPVEPVKEDLEATLFKESVQEVAKKDPKAALLAIIEKWCDETQNVYNPDEMESLADAIMEAKLPI